MHPRPNRPLSWKKKTKKNKKQNNGSYNGDNNMQLIYFTALICISHKTTNPRSNPRPSPTPIQSLNICQLIQNTSLAFALFVLWTSWRRWRWSHWEGGLEKEQHTVANSSLSVYVHEVSFLPTEASWHGLNDCIVKMIFGLLTDGFTTHTPTHTRSPSVSRHSAGTRYELAVFIHPWPRTWPANIHIKPLLA